MVQQCEIILHLYFIGLGPRPPEELHLARLMKWNMRSHRQGVQSFSSFPCKTVTDLASWYWEKSYAFWSSNVNSTVIQQNKMHQHVYFSKSFSMQTQENPKTDSRRLQWSCLADSFHFSYELQYLFLPAQCPTILQKTLKRREKINPAMGYFL